MAIDFLHQVTTLIVIIDHVPIHTDVNSALQYESYKQDFSELITVV